MSAEKEFKGYRSIKQELRKVLAEVPFKKEKVLSIAENPGVLISPLFSFLCSSDSSVRWHAISALGFLVSTIARTNAEQARIVLRRLMWQLNDESGGIGWGCAEAMGEILASCSWLADEYHRILISYIDPEGNLLEHTPLLEGALWGTARLCSVRPDLCQRAFDLSLEYIRSDRVQTKICAGLILCFSGRSELINTALRQMEKDDRTVNFYWNDVMHRCRASECVRLLGCR